LLALPREEREELPTPEMAKRLSADGQLSADGERLQVSIVAHSEAIVLEGVLEPEQMLRAKRRLWSRSALRTLWIPKMAGSREIMALLDPEVAAALRLSRSQRDELVARLEDRAKAVDELNAVYNGEVLELDQAGGRDEITSDQRAAILDKVASDLRVRVMEVEQPVWDILTKAQIKAFRQIVGNSESKPPEKPAAPPKPPERPPVPVNRPSRSGVGARDMQRNHAR
jgi:hypothetical protein